MKFKHFNIEDVLSPDDRKQIEKYIGQKGYYSDNLELFDRYIEDKNILTIYIQLRKASLLDLSLDLVMTTVLSVTTFCR